MLKNPTTRGFLGMQVAFPAQYEQRIRIQCLHPDTY